jgi:hypothetical protein
MNTEFDAFERQLSSFRPAHLPAPARQRILREMQRPVTGHYSAVRLGHRAGLELALAGALCLTLLAGWRWLPRSPRAVSRVNQAAVAAGDVRLPSLAFLEAKLTTASIGANTVAVLCSPSVLTNIQNRR